MHFSSFLAHLLLLAAQINMISAVLTPAQILSSLQDASTDVNNSKNDVSTTTALNAVTNYKLIVQDALDNGNELVEDDASIQGSANLSPASEKTVAVAYGQLTTILITYYETLQSKASFFLDPSQQLGIVAAATSLATGAQAFLLAVASITPNATMKANLLS